MNNSKNAGIDVQGTHTPYSAQSLNPGFNSMTKVANIKVITNFASSNDIDNQQDNLHKT